MLGSWELVGHNTCLDDSTVERTTQGNPRCPSLRRRARPFWSPTIPPGRPLVAQSTPWFTRSSFRRACQDLPSNGSGSSAHGRTRIFGSCVAVRTRAFRAASTWTWRAASSDVCQLQPNEALHLTAATCSVYWVQRHRSSDYDAAARAPKLYCNGCFGVRLSADPQLALRRLRSSRMKAVSRYARNATKNAITTA